MNGKEYVLIRYLLEYLKIRVDDKTIPNMGTYKKSFLEEINEAIEIVNKIRQISIAVGNY